MGPTEGEGLELREDYQECCAACGQDGRMEGQIQGWREEVDQMYREKREDEERKD